jgi:hypothetical protein
MHEEDDQRDEKNKPRDSQDTVGYSLFPHQLGIAGIISSVDCWENVGFCAASFAKYVRASASERPNHAGERGTMHGR